MSELIKAYVDELDLIYNQIDDLWYKADNHLDEDYYLSWEFNEQIKALYNRKAVLKSIINILE